MLICRRAKDLPGASDIEELKDAPGGGYIVTFQDPAGFPVNLVHGQSPVEKGPLPEKLVLNYETEKPRTRTFQRFNPGPAAIHKVSHSTCFSQDNTTDTTSSATSVFACKTSTQ